MHPKKSHSLNNDPNTLERFQGRAKESYINTIASYIPSLLAHHFKRMGELPKEASTWPVSGAILFTDISGFTALTQRLTQEGNSGSEELTRLLNDYFNRLINLITAHGGDILKFAGDAMLAIWPVDDDATGQLEWATFKAAQCALVAQRELNAVELDNDITLSISMSLGAGDLQLVCLGGVLNRFEFTIIGEPLEQVSHADQYAQPGDVIISPQVWQLMREYGLECDARENHFSLTSMQRSAPPCALTPIYLSSFLETVISSYVPAAIVKRVKSGYKDWLGEIRQVSIIFLNLPDVNHRIALEQLQAVIVSLQSIIYRYEGSVNKLSIDDKGTSLIAAFGLPPMSHENDPIRAVRAAQAMQTQLRQLYLSFSIGISSGKVYCGIVGNELRREYTVMGSDVNLSARLMQSASNHCLCDSSTYEMAKSSIVFEALGSKSLKGFAQEVPVYAPKNELVSKQSTNQATHSPIGREHECQSIMMAIEDISIGQKRLLWIEGEAGIGKSTLINYTTDISQDKSLLTLMLHADSLETHTPFYAWRLLFHHLIEVKHAQSDSLSKHWIESHIPAKLKVFIPVLSSLLPYQWDANHQVSSLTSTLRLDYIAQLCVHILNALASEHHESLVLIVEDLHWLDGASWDLLKTVYEQLQQLLLIITTRPESMGNSLPDDHGVLKQLAQTEVLVIDRIPICAIEELLCRKLSATAIHEDIVKLVFQYTEGHPFFAEQFLLALIDSNHIHLDQQRCIPSDSFSKIEHFQLPGTIEGVITSRIDKLDNSEIFNLKVASVIGQTFSLKMVGDIHPLSPSLKDLSICFKKLAKLSLIKDFGEDDIIELSSSFKHAITHKTVYDMMLDKQKETLHFQAAQWYESKYNRDLSLWYPIIGYHYRQAGRIEQAIDYFRRAGNDAIAKGANSDAIKHFSQALDLIEKLPLCDDSCMRKELEICLEMGPALLAVTGWASNAIGKNYERAYQLAQYCRNSHELFKVSRGLWGYYMVSAQLAQSITIAQELNDISDKDKNIDFKLETHAAFCDSYFWQAEIDKALSHAQDGLKLYSFEQHHESHGADYGEDPAAIFRCYSSALYWLLGDSNNAKANVDYCLKCLDDYTHTFSKGFLLFGIGLYYLYSKNIELTEQYSRQLVELSLENNFPPWLAVARVQHGWAIARQGQLDSGVGEILHGMSELKKNGTIVTNCMNYCLLADIYYQNQVYDTALHYTQEGLNHAEYTEERQYLPELYRMRADINCQLNPLVDLIETDYRCAIELAEQQKAQPFAIRSKENLVLWLNRR